MKRSASLLTAAFIALSACTTQENTAQTNDADLPALPHDTHSYAQPEKARVTNVSLDLTPDFTAKKIHGIARLAFQRVQNADSIVLDTRDLTIKSVKDSKGAALGF